MEDITVREFKARISHYLKLMREGKKISVRGQIIANVTTGDHGVTTDVQKKQVSVVTEDKPVVQNSVVDQLRAQVSEIENRGKIQQVDSPAPIPEVWHKEELEEEEKEKFVVCEVCRDGRAEKTFYDAGGAGEVEICRQCARMKYAGSMRTFDGYWKKLQDINLY